jgi:hypothetical protein
VAWDVADYVFVGALLVVAGIMYALVARKTATYRAAVGIAVAASLILIVVNGAVGVIGSEDDDANLMYGGVIAVAIIGALIARFRPRGMARALVATALAQTLVAAIALIAGLGSTGARWPWDVVGLTAFLVALWLTSAWLFRMAARERTPAAARPEAI